MIMNDKSGGYRTLLPNNQSVRRSVSAAIFPRSFRFQSIAAIIDLVNRPLLIHKRPRSSKLQIRRMFRMYPVAAVRSTCAEAIDRICRLLGNIYNRVQTRNIPIWLKWRAFQHTVLWVFSNLQRINSKNRNTLTQEHTTNLMRISFSTLINCDDFIQNINMPIQDTPY